MDDPKKSENKTEQDELYLLQTENRHLKDTIAALREALEKSFIERDEAVQKTVAETNDEIVQLKATIGALRDELEYNTIKHEENIQELTRNAHDEMKQLHETISALRNRLEENNAR